MVAIIDYGVGNLFSLNSSLKYIGAEAVVTGDKNAIKKADRLILPGVGAFEDAAKKLKQSGLSELIKELAQDGKPIMGICLGMQLLFDRSYEYGCHEGLGLIPGEIMPLEGKIPANLKIPHIGWNSVKKVKDCPVFKSVNDGDFFYFVHSYYACECEENVALLTDYGFPVTAAVAKGNIIGCQFHPEKSGEAGLKLLRDFVFEENLK